MLSVLLIWIEMFLTTLIAGAGFLRLFHGKKQSLVHFFLEDVCLCGMMVVTVYAQVFSFFGGVGLSAQILLVLGCAALYFLVLKKGKGEEADLFWSGYDRWKAAARGKKIAGILFGSAVVLVMAYGSSRGYFHYDSDLYHGQAIHWIEEYGLVKGLGNLHGRLAYNSSSFALTALYSFAFLGGQSYHPCAGFMALLLLLSCLRVGHIYRDHLVRVSDFVRLSGIYYILNIFDEMVSPASDYFTMLVFFYVVIRTLDVLEGEKDTEGQVEGMYLPSFMAFYLLTLKLSAAPAVLVAILPLVFLIRRREWKRIAVCVGIAMGITLPYLVRNVILSGWLLYPSTLLDLFPVDWKISRESARVDADYIIAFGRGFSNMGAAHMSVGEWFPTWLGKLGRTEKGLFLLGVIGTPMAGIVLALRCRWQEGYVLALVLASYLFWLLSSPLVRYGQGYLLCLPFLCAGCVAVYLWKREMAVETGGDRDHPKRWKRVWQYGIIAVFSLFFLYKAVMLAGEVRSTSWQEYYLLQQDYGTYDTVAVPLGNTQVYAPLGGDRTGYAPFPSVPVAEDLPELYDPAGIDFSQGFH